MTRRVRAPAAPMPLVRAPARRQALSASPARVPGGADAPVARDAEGLSRSAGSACDVPVTAAAVTIVQKFSLPSADFPAPLPEG